MQAWRSAAGMGLAFGSKVLFVLAWQAALYAVWRQPNFERLLQSGCWLFLAILLIAPVFRVWYVAWPLALAALLEWRVIGRLTSTFAASAPLVYLDWGSNNWFGVFVFLPVLVMLLYEFWHARVYHWRSLLKVYSAVRGRAAQY
jgi:hypothetical protein